MDDLLKLAERCEAATGPDRELDEDIACALNIAQRREGFVYWMNEAGSTNELWHHHIDYTTSLDAAMTLVPEVAKVATQNFGGPGPMALVEPNERFASGKTLALAICAAALRARSSVTVRGE